MTVSIKSGTVLSYPYLWHWQNEKGETEGRKTRPVCIAISLVKGDLTHLFLLAITSTEPQQNRPAIAVPQIEAKRAGLNPSRPSWIIFDEYNYDVLERSYYFDPAAAPMGRFSETFTNQIKAAFHSALENKSVRNIDRI